MAQNAHNSVMVLTLLLKMAMLIIAVRMFCEVGENVSNMFGKFGYEVGQIKWYLLPKPTQQLLVTIINFCQNPVALDGFGSIKGSREVSKHVSSFQTKGINFEIVELLIQCFYR